MVRPKVRVQALGGVEIIGHNPFRIRNGEVKDTSTLATVCNHHLGMDQWNSNVEWRVVEVLLLTYTTPLAGMHLFEYICTQLQ